MIQHSVERRVAFNICSILQLAVGLTTQLHWRNSTSGCSTCTGVYGRESSKLSAHKVANQLERVMLLGSVDNVGKVEHQDLLPRPLCTPIA